MEHESEPRMAFGATDRVPCSQCNGEMVVVRRTLSHKHREYEYQILKCTACEKRQDRTINMRSEILG